LSSYIALAASKEKRKTRSLAVIDIIREKVRNQEYEFAISHFFEEMANDDLIFADIEAAIAKGKIRKRFTRDPRGTRFEIIGPAATDGRPVAIVCRIKSTGKLLFITTYLVE
jgi:hypothetical protein